jgi:hypothetical protein
MVALGGLWLVVDGRAQTPPAPADSATATPASTGVTPLARFVPRDNLIFYVQFDGLDAHAAAWQKTVAYRMLNSTPLGAMLEDVAAQLLEKPLSGIPNRKLMGADVVNLVKAMAHRGWALSVSASKDAKTPVLGTLVLRGLAAKDLRPLSGKLMGMFMGNDKPRIERRGDRPLVMLSGASGQPSGVWWTEKDDLVLGLTGPADADAIIAALDGKTPSATDHAVLGEITRTDGSFVPLMAAFIDPAAVPPPPPGLTAGPVYALFDQLRKAGLNRLDYRWGFDDDGLMSVTRLVAPAPRKSLLAMFDQPKLDTKNLIPIPEGVDSFLLLSVTPSKVLDALADAGPGGSVKAKIDEFLGKLKEQNRIEFEKDFLGNLGPKMAFYVAPNRSAAATDDAPEATAKSGGLDPTTLLSSLQSALPKPTLVAEVNDPKAFGKALDTVMIAVNKELKAMAIEKAASEEEAGTTAPNGPGAGPTPGVAGGPGRFGARRAGAEGGGAGPGERPARKRSSKEIPVPYFQLMTGGGAAKSYRLIVPAESSIKLGASGVHPTVRMEDKYVAFSSTSEAARTAIDIIKKKNWKPSADVEQAVSRVPSELILLAVVDPRESTPQLLASLPGTLQTQINTVIAMSAAGPAAGLAGGAPGMAAAMPGSPAAAPPRGLPGKPAMGGMGPGGSSSGGASGGPPGGSSGAPAGYPGASSGGYPGMARPGGGYPGMSSPPGYPGGAGGAGMGGGGTPTDAMIELKVDHSKLPKAEELKALMYPGTLAVAVDDQAIRIISRESFPNIVGGIGGGAVGTALLLPAIQSARRAAQEAAARAAAAAPGQPPAGSAPGGSPGATAGATAPAPTPGTAPGGPQTPAGRGRRRGGPE